MCACTDGVGGSTLILLFQPGTLGWDDDLIANSSQCLETLVLVSGNIFR